MPVWRPIEEHQRGKDPLHVAGWTKAWGVAEFMLHDDGWTLASFNGGIKRVKPTLWQPMPEPPVQPPT